MQSQCQHPCDDLLSREEAGVCCTSAVRRTQGRDWDRAPGKGCTSSWCRHTFSSCSSCSGPCPPPWSPAEGTNDAKSLSSPGRDSLRKLLWSQLSGCCQCREVWGWGMALHSICPPLIPRQTQLFHLCSRSCRAHHTSHLI